MAGTQAVVLLSGGLDSATAAAVAKDEGHRIMALTVDYGQTHTRELASARKLADHFDVLEHRVVKVDIGQWGGSALTDKTIPIPTNRSTGDIPKVIPPTYVPARNTIMLALALGYAEATGSGHIYIGVNAVDYSGYPDCRPEFIESFQRTADLATKKGVEGSPIRIHAPLQNMTKSEIIKKGLALGVPYHLTWSCYRGGRRACGRCDSCLLRLAGFKGAGSSDTIEYEV